MSETKCYMFLTQAHVRGHEILHSENTEFGADAHNWDRFVDKLKLFLCVSLLRSKDLHNRKALFFTSVCTILCFVNRTDYRFVLY